ncbi:transmembrane protein 45B-like [Dendronephthya gigantea]|uniref:transmembrane protein 45B-like n=1 Tax=Dendronephthya gigantea TaxID=151771 RepID=UPI001068EB7F|nr:transmembrane protein 45B-like [Dendronephthya gigantea]XP_028392861.1 transmembrane protein 45B-like [Dendronephthya gigantea]
MGSFEGHALPGSLFIAFGLWWLVHVILDYAKYLKRQNNRGQSSNIGSWRRFPTRRLRNVPLEPGLKLAGTFAGIIAELFAIHFRLVDENNDFVKPDKFAHSTMYAFFGFSGLIEIFNHYRITHFSKEAEYIILGLAFAVEGTLFAFHLHGRDIFDVRIHTLLYIIIYLAALVVLLEACLPRFRRELFVARTVLVLTQGTWFWEIAYTIYGANKWFVYADKDLTEMQLMLDTEVMTISIMWHLFGWLTVVLFCCISTNCLHKYKRIPSCCFDNGNTERGLGLLNEKLLKESEIELSDEEEILIKRSQEETMNLTSEFLNNNSVEEDLF